jgi:hypothetical protein
VFRRSVILNPPFLQLVAQPILNHTTYVPSQDGASTKLAKLLRCQQHSQRIMVCEVINRIYPNLQKSLGFEETDKISTTYKQPNYC